MSYTVVHADLVAMATAFKTRGDSMETRWRSPIGPASTGDAGCDATLRSLLLTLELDGSNLAEAVGDHGAKLSKAADAYEATDADSALLFDSLLERLED